MNLKRETELAEALEENESLQQEVALLRQEIKGLAQFVMWGFQDIRDGNVESLYHWEKYISDMIES